MFFSTDKSSDYLLKAQAGVEAALTTMLALVLTVDNTYDNEPAAGKDKNDLAITSALKISI
jgi:putative salt-induced outer membrane protein YdiY